MREPDVYKPPMEEAEKRRRRAGNWHGVFLLTAATVMVATFLAGTWQPPRWAVMALIGTLGILGTTTVGLLVRALDELRARYRMLWTDYADLRSEHSKRASFMIRFTPSREDVERVLQNAAYAVLMRHRQITELHERGIPAPETENPDAQLAALKRNYEEKLHGLEVLMKGELEQFRSLRDIAKWAGEKRFNVRESWWDYIAPKDLPKKSRRADRTGLSTPIDTSTAYLARSQRAMEALLVPDAEKPQPPPDPIDTDCGCPPDDCSHRPLEAKPEPDGFVAHEGSIRPHPFRKSGWVGVEGANEQPGE